MYKRIPSFTSLNLSTKFLKLVEFFLIFIFLWIIFKPTQLISVNLYLPVYVASMFSVVWMLIRQGYENISVYKWWIFFCIFSMFLLAIKSAYHSEVYNYRLIFNWAAWFCIMSLGYWISKRIDSFESLLSNLFKFILVCQLLLVLVQLFYPSAFDIFWSSNKTHGIGEIVRVTGSLYNPNYFAFVVTLCVSGVIAYSGPKSGWQWILLGYALVILSGSRTLIIGFPLVVMSWYYLQTGMNWSSRVGYFILGASGLYIVAYLSIYILEDTLKYSAQMLHIYFAENIGLENVKTYVIRTELWNASMVEFMASDITNKLFGSHGPFRIDDPHQNFIFVLTRYGFLGLLMHIALIALLLHIAYKMRQTYCGKFLYMVLLLYIGAGLSSTYSAKMSSGIFLALISGFVLARVQYYDEK